MYDTSSNSSSSPGATCANVCFTDGLLASFFEPTGERNALNAAHTWCFMISSHDLFFLCFAVAVLRCQNQPLITILAPMLLAPATVMSILYNILAATISTLIGSLFADHSLSLLPYHFICSTTQLFYLQICFRREFDCFSVRCDQSCGCSHGDPFIV